jgi:hypothetical protein
MRASSSSILASSWSILACGALLVEIVDLRQQGQHQSLQAFGIKRIDLIRRHP